MDMEYMHDLFLSTLPARGATGWLRPPRIWPRIFLSTLPARGATRLKLRDFLGETISIHAPREGSDQGRL